MTKPVGIEITKYCVSYHPELATVTPDFVIQRTGYGMVKDELYDVLHPGVMQIPRRLAYHYLSSAAPWKDQADKFLSIVRDDFHGYELDFEEGYNNFNDTFAGMAIEWIKYIKAHTAKRVQLYLTSYNYRDLIYKNYPTYAPTLPLCIASYFLDASGKQYTPDPQTQAPKTVPPRPWQSGDMWQFAAGEKDNHGKQYGVGSVGLEMDVFNGTLADFDAAFGIGAFHVPVVVPPTTTPRTITSVTVAYSDGTQTVTTP